MESFFITKIDIKKVRHLQNVEIDISDTERKHLILTGKNGSGKTSVLEAIKNLIFGFSQALPNIEIELTNNEINLATSFHPKVKISKLIGINKWNFSAVRSLKVEKSAGVKDKITNKVEDFEKYLAKKRTEQAFLSFERENEKEVKVISEWFDKLESSLRFLFEDESLKLISKRTEDKLNFYLTSDYREEFDFNTLSSGYSSVLYILFDMMQQMQNEGGSFDYTKEGIALIDEVEAHLHISLQKKILPFLTEFFPNVQFIVTTHSPFILQSLKNAVIFDLETKKRYEDFSNYSSESILETFYDMDKFGDLMKQDMDKYEALLQSVNGKNKKAILEMRKKFLEVPDIEVSYWIKDMDIRHREKNQTTVGMINIQRTTPAPPSLASESFNGVKEVLINMQANKCYLCERKAPDTSQIEHFIPTNNGGEELQYVWENLFLACDHCNSIKNNVSDKKKPTLSLLVCTDFSTIITDAIHFYCEGKPREKVIITPVLDEPSQNVLDTVFLLNSIFNYHSESLAFDAKVLTDEVIKEMKKLLDLLHDYEFGSYTPVNKEGVLMKITQELSVESPFTAFKIWYIKRNFEGSEFMDLLPRFVKS